MSELLCVTDRKLCRGDFLERVEALAACRPRGIILREKDLPEQEYKALAARAAAICRARVIANSRASTVSSLTPAAPCVCTARSR